VAKIRPLDVALSRATAQGALIMQSRVSIARSALARELSRAEDQVAKDPDRISHQRGVVSHHEDGGLDSAIARAILEQLETLQRVHIADRDRLLAKAAPEPLGSYGDLQRASELLERSDHGNRLP
jgi:hypothetical protein